MLNNLDDGVGVAMPTCDPVSRPILRVCAVSKRFGATQALKDVSLDFRSGEVHALLGENGAGKSTLVKIFSGACSPDEGRLEFDGRIVPTGDPLWSRKAGIAMIYQELILAPQLTVEENILLGAEPSRCGWIDRAAHRRIAREALERLNRPDLQLEERVCRLSIGDQQVVEIARACLGAPRVIIMDEPTSSLTRVDVECLFGIVATLKKAGVSVIYISHFLEECEEIVDRFTVLRDGCVAGEGRMRETSLTEIIQMMVGRDIAEAFPKNSHEIGDTAIELRELSGELAPRSVTCRVRSGEIFGVAGLIGSGRSETARVLFGLDRVKSGAVLVRGVDSTHSSPARRLAEGIGLLSENRKEEGLMLNRSVAENLTITRLSDSASAGVIDQSRQTAEAESLISALEIKAYSAWQPVAELSGGNQQKVALGRLLHHEASIMILDEPTRGVDIVSKTQIYRIMGDLAAAGKSIIFISSYLPELLAVCDTIGVMYRGEIAQVKPAADWTEEQLLGATMGQ